MRGGHRGSNVTRNAVLMDERWGRWNRSIHAFRAGVGKRAPLRPRQWRRYTSPRRLRCQKHSNDTTSHVPANARRPSKTAAGSLIDARCSLLDKLDVPGVPIMVSHCTQQPVMLRSGGHVLAMVGQRSRG